MMPVSGLCAFPITPGDDDGRVETDAMRRLIRRLVPSGVQSIGLLGSTGSAPYFSRDQRRRAIEATIDEAAGRLPVMVGIGALRTSEAIALGQDAAACGADAILLAPVSYTPLTEAEVFHHVATVADAVDLPLCIYNNPGTTHFTFGPALIGRLSRVARIVAVKTPAPELPALAGELAALRAQAGADFSVGASVDARAAEALLAGFDAWYSVLAGILPELCVPIMRAVQAGDPARARALNAALQPLWDAFATHTSLRVTYAAASLLGVCQAAPPRPILNLDPPAQRRIASLLESLGVLH
jgi:4-hydroxy-tetrahydrodipicolinate synthase